MHKSKGLHSARMEQKEVNARRLRVTMTDGQDDNHSSMPNRKYGTRDFKWKSVDDKPSGSA